jgi:adenylate kinase family enzyme
VIGLAPAAIAIAGPIGAGKTTLTALLSTQLGWPRTAYGDVLRSDAAYRGLPASRVYLQQLAMEMISDGWEAFTAKLVQQANPAPGQGLIVDGLRHPGAAAALKAAVRPWHTYVINLDIPPGLGLDRAARRDQLADPTWRQAASHPVESELPAVKATAHLVIAATTVTPQRAAQLVMFCLVEPGGSLSGALCA